MKLIVGNWKMNPASLDEAVALTSKISALADLNELRQVILLPPFVFLEELAKKFKQINWGAQDVFWEQKGAYTGEISAAMLRNIGVNWILVGHSERRRYFGEDDETVNKKLHAVLENGFNVIVAVGELQKGDSDEVVETSFRKSIADVAPSDLNRLAVAYEPVWAIGTGEADDPARSNQIVGQLKSIAGKMLGEDSKQIRFLYGGSVNSASAASFLSQPHIDGALVGGASLDAQEFVGILRADY